MASLTLTPKKTKERGDGIPLSLNSPVVKTEHRIIEGAKSKEELIKLYDFGKVIGSGASSTVRLIRLKSASKELRALKIVQKSMVHDKVRLQREVTVQKNCDHPGIVKIFDVFESETSVYIVLEYMQGGELYDVIVEKGKLIEAEVQAVALQILKGIAYMDEREIIHRDIKPENILLYKPFTKDLSDIYVKLSDFGSSRYLIDRTPPQSPVVRGAADSGKKGGDSNGSNTLSSAQNATRDASNALTRHVHQKPRRGSRTDQLKKENNVPTRRRAYSAVFTDYFIAPEVLVGKGYDGKVDMWSMGVVIYILLSGFPPFFEDKDGNIETGSSLKQRILNGQFGFPSPYWDDISENAKHLIRRMLTVDPKRRINASEAIQHPFFNKRTLSMEELERNFQTIKLEQQQKNNLRHSFSSSYSDGGSDAGITEGVGGMRVASDGGSKKDGSGSTGDKPLAINRRKSADRRRKRVDTPTNFGDAE